MIRSHKSNTLANRNSQNLKTTNDLQNITQKTKYRVTLTPLRTGGELRFSRRVSGSCSSSGTRCGTVTWHKHYVIWNSCWTRKKFKITYKTWILNKTNVKKDESNIILLGYRRLRHIYHRKCCTDIRRKSKTVVISYTQKLMVLFLINIHHI